MTEIRRPLLTKFRQILRGNIDQYFFEKECFRSSFYSDQPLTIRHYEMVREKPVVPGPRAVWNWQLFVKGCCVYSSSVKQCLPSVNHEQFPIQMTQKCKHSKCLQILAEKDFPLILLGRTPIKIHRRTDRRRQPRSREHRFSTAKATQRPQTCLEAATK